MRCRLLSGTGFAPNRHPRHGFEGEDARARHTGPGRTTSSLSEEVRSASTTGRGAATAQGVPLDRRPAGARGRRRAVPAARPQPRAPLQRRQRAARGPRAGRLPGARPGRRRLRPHARDGVHLLRGAEHRRRDQAALPRQRLVGAGPARPAGAGAARRAAQRRADLRDRPRPDRRRRSPSAAAASRSRTCWRRARRSAPCTPTRSTSRAGRATTRTRARCSTRSATPTSSSVRAHDRTALYSVLDTLDERDRTIIRLYYKDELTQAEIGRRLGYSQMHVSRLLRQAVERLRLDRDAAGEPGRRSWWPPPPRSASARRSLFL